MTKIRKTGSSSMVEDRRGSGGRSGGLGGMLGGGGGGGLGFPTKMGGGIVGLLIAVAVLVLPRLLNGAGTTNDVAGSGGGAQTAASDGACNDELESILCGATEDVQGFWQRDFEARGGTYEVTKTVFFSGATDTGCGTASSSTGPFYCPADHRVYFDLDFLTELQNRFDAQGDLAAQYIVAHEYGHHVQSLLGANDRMQQLQQQNPDRANDYSVALELQADCLAGVWADDARDRNQFESDNEVQEALDAAAAVGDDRIQQQTQGRVDPETFTHGTSEQRMSWFKRGYDSGDLDQCDTFAEL